MTELEQARADLYKAEASLKTKEYEMFIIRYLILPAFLAFSGSLVAATIAMVTILFKLAGD